jgi:uncharacterized protein YdhG (YjbR/CyaY superfamily)
MRAEPKVKPKTIDEYLAALDRDKRRALQALRKQIRDAAPGATECISYGLAGFKLDGKMLIWMGAASGHCALYPGAIVGRFADELTSYETSKGTIRFQPGKPLPASLVRKLVKACIAKGGARSRARA